MKLAERNTKGSGPIRAEELGYFPVEGGETEEFKQEDNIDCVFM